MINKESKNIPPEKRSVGRPKGTPNKKTDWVFELCEKHNFDPLETLIYIAKGDWKSLGFAGPTIEKFGSGNATIEEYVINTGHIADAAKTLAKFMYPTRKAIEITNDSEAQNGFKFQLVPPDDAKA